MNTRPKGTRSSRIGCWLAALGLLLIAISAGHRLGFPGSWQIAFAVLGGLWSLRARTVRRVDGPDPDRLRRLHYLGSYAMTSVSMLLLAAIGFV